MSLLKGLLATILTMLLFFSLAVFSTLFMLRITLLDPDFVVAQVDRLDVSALAREMIEEQVSGQLPPEAAFLEEALYETIEDNEPLIKEQVNAAIYSSYDYLLGKTDRLYMVFSLEPLKADLKDRVWQLFQQNIESLPPQVSALPPEILRGYFEEFYQQFAPYVFHTHMKDGTGSRENYQGAALGDGEIHLDYVVELLKDAGYDGVWCAEYEGPEVAGGVGYRKCLEWMQQHIG